ncbi:hypothetical protein DWY45_17070, partial [Phocaeicola plebeius]
MLQKNKYYLLIFITTINKKRLSQNETAFFVFAKKIGQVLTSLSQNLPRLPNFLYLRESSQDIPKIMFKNYTSNDNLLLPPCLG